MAIVQAGKVITNNPYFPNSPLAYPLGSHIIIANLSILSGVPVPVLVALSPLLFGILIVLAFYSLALRFLTRPYAQVATLLFYSASIIPILERAVNGAPILNSLLWPFTSILVGVFLFYVVLLTLSLNEATILRPAITGMVFGTLVLTFHLLALGEFLIIIGYAVARHSYKDSKETILTLLVATLVSSSYDAHIILSGIPSETGAFGTYVQLSPTEYISTLGPAISILMAAGALFVAVTYIKKRSLTPLWSVLGEKKNLVLFVSITVFLAASQAWRLGLVLVNDLFLFFIVGPIAIVATLVLMRINRQPGIVRSQILATMIVSIIVIIGPLAAYESIQYTPIMTGPQAYFDAPYDGAINWLNSHAAGQVFASELDAQYLISSKANVLPVAISPVISDYYVRDLSNRLQALRDILGDSIPASVGALTTYNVSYVVSVRPQPTYSITGSPYVTPLYPVQACFHGSDTTSDFDYDGAPETYDEYFANETNYYLLSNPNLKTTLSLDYFFYSQTYGPVNIYVNNTLVQTLTGSIRGSWTSTVVQLPPSLVGQVEDVRIVNEDLANEWYLQSISIGSSFQCPAEAIPYPRETVFQVQKSILHTSVLNPTEPMPQKIEEARNARDWLLRSSSIQEELNQADNMNSSVPHWLPSVMIRTDRGFFDPQISTIQLTTAHRQGLRRETMPLRARPLSRTDGILFRLTIFGDLQ